MRPEPVAEAAVFFPDPLETPGIIDHRLILPAGTDHTLRIHNAVNVRFGIIGNPVIIKAVKAFPEDLPFFQHQAPRKAALHGFHHQVFEHNPVIMDRNTPLGIMIDSHGFKGKTPVAGTHGFHSVISV
jgi:hypothetical protein